MDDEKKKLGWSEYFFLFSGAAALGAIISMPLVVMDLSHRIDKQTDTYLAVEMCKAGSDLDFCRELRGEAQ